MRKLLSVDEVMAALPKHRQEAIVAKGNLLLARVQRRMTLAELRKGRKISQATLAETLGIGQMQISRLEKRKDPRLSTMQRAVAAMGGSLTVIATFPDQEPIIIAANGPSSQREHPAKAKAKATAVPVVSSGKRASSKRAAPSQP